MTSEGLMQTDGKIFQEGKHRKLIKNQLMCEEM